MIIIVLSDFHAWDVSYEAQCRACSPMHLFAVAICSDCRSVQVVKQHLPTRSTSLRVNVDATKCGNITRFINHSCGAANAELCLASATGCLLPRLVVVARRLIAANEEITIEYGPPNEQTRGCTHCLCGSSFCRGGLPCQSV